MREGLAAATAPRGRGGIRFGPIVFVPELLTTPGDDPWAKRKGEPRIFALLWCLYLMVSALGTIFTVRFLGIPDTGEYRFACVMMCVMCGIGIGVLWPMLRLCQASPGRGLVMRAVMVDAMVVALPVLAVIVPLPMLTDWPMEVSWAIGIVMAGWALIVAALIAWGYKSGRRLAAMMAILVLVCAGAVAMVVAEHRSPLLPGDQAVAPEMGRRGVLSPLTAASALSWSPSGLSPRMSGGEWRMVLASPAAGCVLFVLVGRRGQRTTHKTQCTEHNAQTQNPSP